jgi:hypothetical protein
LFGSKINLIDESFTDETSKIGIKITFRNIKLDIVVLNFRDWIFINTEQYSNYNIDSFLIVIGNNIEKVTILDNIQFFDEFTEDNKIKVVSEKQQSGESHYEKEYTLSLKNEKDNRYFCLDI